VGTSVSLVDYVKLLGVTFDKHLNFDTHISMYALHLHPTSIFMLSAIFALFSEISKTVGCAFVSSRLDYVNFILTGISFCNIQRLQLDGLTVNSETTLA